MSLTTIFDGTCCAYILINLFKAIKYDNFECYMPNRQKEKYGISVDIVNKFFAENNGAGGLIITADNGISAFDAIERARELGIDVIVTDHHEVQTIADELGEVTYNLPNANAIVNPHQYDCTYPYKMLSGGAVVYKLSQGLIMKSPLEVRREFLLNGYSKKIICAAAISAIGDVMKILGENRALVKEALPLLDEGVIPAAKALMPEASVMNVSFKLGPHLSSVGRLSDMNKSLQFLLEEDELKIQEMLPRIKEYNEIRKSEQELGISDALEIINTYDELPDIIIEVLDGIKPTVLGLVAGKIKERFNRPAIFFSETDEGIYKGSGRSIENCSLSLFNEIEPLFKTIPGLNGGGHVAACGLNLANESYSDFKKAMLDKFKLTEFDKTPKIYIDKYLSIREDFMKLHKDLSLLEPYGVGNPTPVFAIKSVYLDFEFKKHKYGEFAIISITDNLEDNFYVEGICWNEDLYLKNGKKVFDVVPADIIVGIEINSYTKKPRLNIKAINFL